MTLEDIIEEIVGDIRDEHDETVQGVRKQRDGSVVVDGAVTIRELNRAMGWNLPDEEAATVAGLVIHEARAIPEPRQTFSFYGFRFEVLRKQRNRIAALRVTPLARERRRRESRSEQEGETGRSRRLAACAPLPRRPACLYKRQSGERPAIESIECPGTIKAAAPGARPGAARGDRGRRVRRPAISRRSSAASRRRSASSRRAERAARARAAASAGARSCSSCWRRSSSGSPGARSTPSSPTRSASTSCSAAIPARPRPASTPTGPGRSAR